MSLPPHFVDEKNKEVVFHLKGGYPVTMAILTWMKSFPEPPPMRVKPLPIPKTMTGPINLLQLSLD